MLNLNVEIMKCKLLDKLIMLAKYLLTTTLMFILMLNVTWATDVASQEVKSVTEVSLNLKVQDATLSELFNVIEDNTDFYFSFSSALQGRGRLGLLRLLRLNKMFLITLTSRSLPLITLERTS